MGVALLIIGGVVASVVIGALIGIAIAGSTKLFEGDSWDS